MPKFNKKGLPNFDSAIQTGTGESWDRSADLICHLRADNRGIFTDRASNLAVSGSGTNASLPFVSPYRVSGYAATFDGSTTIMALTGSVNIAVPASASYLFTTAGGTDNASAYESNAGLLTFSTDATLLFLSSSDGTAYPYQDKYAHTDGHASPRAVGFDFSADLGTASRGATVRVYVQMKFATYIDSGEDMTISWHANQSWHNTDVSAKLTLWQDNGSGGWTKILGELLAATSATFAPADAGDFHNGVALNATAEWKWYKIELADSVGIDSLARIKFTNGANDNSEYWLLGNPIVTSDTGFGTETNRYLSLYPDDSCNVCIAGWINLASLPAGSPGGRAIIEQTFTQETADPDYRLYSTTVFVNSSGQLGVRLHDRDNANVLKFFGKIAPITKAFKVDQWHHFVVIINETGNFVSAVDNTKFEMYIDGVGVTLTTESGAGGNTLKSAPRYNGEWPITVGFGRGGYDSGGGGSLQADNYLDGSLAEVAMWRGTTAFGSTDAYAIHRAYKNPGSGFIGVPPRLRLRELDENSVRPPIARPGDIRRIGNNTIFFDDSRATILNPGTTTCPAILHQSDPLLASIYNGYLDGGLTFAHTPSTNIYQENYRRQDRQQDKGALTSSLGYSPFDESRIYIDFNSSFYNTGTLDSVLPGFDNPLWSKEQVVIEIPIGTATTLGNTGNVVPGENVPGVGYYNWTTKKVDTLNSFVGFHDGMAEDHADNIAYAIVNRAGAMVHAPIGQFLTGGHVSQAGGGASTLGNVPAISDFRLANREVAKSQGRITDAFGFPDDQRYRADGHQILDMSTLLTQPFLLEKFVLEMDVEFDMSYKGFKQWQNYTWTDPTGDGTHAYARWRTKKLGNANLFNFFMLKQLPGNTSFQRSIIRFRGGVSSDVTGRHDVLMSFSDATHSRELISDARVFFNALDEDVKALAPELFQEFSVVLPMSSGSGGPTSHRIKITDHPRNIVPHLAGQANFLFRPAALEPTSGYTAGINQMLLGYSGGPKNADPLNVGGNFNGSFEGIETRVTVKIPKGVNYAPAYQIPLATLASPQTNMEIEIASPMTGSRNPTFVLQPSDKIILGFDLTGRMGMLDTQYRDSGYHSIGDEPYITIPVQTAKLTLFGSYVSAGAALQPTLNQLLTNDTVFESIGSESILDQFDTTNRQSFSGSYADEVMSGSSDPARFYYGYNHQDQADQIPNPNTYLARRALYRASTGNIGIKGALRRTVRHAMTERKIYDSIPPDIFEIWKTDTGFRAGAAPKMVGTGGFEETGVISLNSDYAFIYGFPFESRYEGIGRVDDFKSRDRKTPEYVGFAVHAPTSYTTVDPLMDLWQNPSAGGPMAPLVGNIAAKIQPQLEHPSTLPVGSADLTAFWANREEVSTRNLPVAVTIGNTEDGTYLSADSPFGYLDRANDKVRKILFGIGDRNRGRFKGQERSGVAKVYDISIRGFKYGLSNASVTYASAVYRRDRYGQLRDMLEMGGNYAVLVSNTVVYPTTAQFYDRDGTVATNRETTSCSNLSTYMTSSAPYFDRDSDSDDLADITVIRNRGVYTNENVDIAIEF